MTQNIIITQTVAILIDGNNIERSLQQVTGDKNIVLDFDAVIPRLLAGRGLNRLVYFREGKDISTKLSDRIQGNYHGRVVACHKSADVPLAIYATQIAEKVDTVVIMSGDSDYVELVRYLQSRGVRVEIAAVTETTARVLVEEADLFVPLARTDGFSFSPKRKKDGDKRSEVTKPEPSERSSKKRKYKKRKKGGDGDTSVIVVGEDPGTDWVPPWEGEIPGLSTPESVPTEGVIGEHREYFLKGKNVESNE